MGNASSVRSIPSDVTKCSMNQLQLMINTAIINNPWNMGDEDLTDAELLYMNIKMMARNGLRPITPEEYAAGLKMNGATKGKKGGNIYLWRTFDGQIPQFDKNKDSSRIFSRDNISSVSATDISMTESEQRLPTTSEEAANYLDDLECMKESSGRCDTQCDTVEWATAY